MSDSHTSRHHCLKRRYTAALPLALLNVLWSHGIRSAAESLSIQVVRRPREGHGACHDAYQRLNRHLHIVTCALRGPAVPSPRSCSRVLAPLPSFGQKRCCSTHGVRGNGGMNCAGRRETIDDVLSSLRWGADWNMSFGAEDAVISRPCCRPPQQQQQSSVRGRRLIENQKFSAIVIQFPRLVSSASTAAVVIAALANKQAPLLPVELIGCEKRKRKFDHVRHQCRLYNTQARLW